jgi:hypothetical protein
MNKDLPSTEGHTGLRRRALGGVETKDVADDLGHGLVVGGRDEVAELAAGVQGTRQRRVLDDRDAVLGC